MMRTFDTGATRDNVEGKLSYMRALSPAVLKGYVQYLDRHRQTANGVRAFDNWKNGIAKDAYMDSLMRHTQDAILAYFGEKPAAKDFTTLLDLLYAIMFNTNGMIFELLVEAGEATRERCTPSVTVESVTASYSPFGDLPGEHIR